MSDRSPNLRLADEIERLRAHNALLRAECRTWRMKAGEKDETGWLVVNENGEPFDMNGEADAVDAAGLLKETP